MLSFTFRAVYFTVLYVHSIDLNFDFLTIMKMINYSVILIIPFFYLFNDKTRRQIEDLIQKNEIEY